MSDITSIIRENDLKIGDLMLDAEGGPIPDSTVLGSSTWAHLDEGRCVIERHDVIHDRVVRMCVDDAARTALMDLLGN